MRAVPEAGGRVAKWVPLGRKLHLIDIENLCGGSHVASECVASAVADYIGCVDVAEMDHTLFACSPQLVVPTILCKEDCRVLIGRGVDGADLALLGAVSAPDVAGRYAEVVIASGDHIFRRLVVELRLLGVPVTVASRASALSRELARVASKIVYLPEPIESAGEISIGRVA